MSLLLKTGSVEVEIHALICRQLDMYPLLNDLPIMDDNDLPIIRDRGKTIRHHKQSASFQEGRP
jgi:hypothetical protein